jgi:predicted nucleotidyltransferase
MVDYLSVTEYAKLHRKDPGNIRRLLASGRIPGEKVGKQWIIPSGAVYPEDKREKSGRYHNWRKRIGIQNNKKILMDNISEMISSLSVIYGSLMYKAILYGSYARGEETNESDVDIAILLLDKPNRETTKKMVDCVASYELKCDKVLSVIDINYDKFNKWKDVLPFYKNILKEGIVLWKTEA